MADGGLEGVLDEVASIGVLADEESRQRQ